MAARIASRVAGVNWRESRRFTLSLVLGVTNRTTYEACVAVLPSIKDKFLDALVFPVDMLGGAASSLANRELAVNLTSVLSMKQRRRRAVPLQTSARFLKRLPATMEEKAPPHRGKMPECIYWPHALQRMTTLLVNLGIAASRRQATLPV